LGSKWKVTARLATRVEIKTQPGGGAGACDVYSPSVRGTDPFREDTLAYFGPHLYCHHTYCQVLEITQRQDGLSYPGCEDTMSRAKKSNKANKQSLAVRFSAQRALDVAACLGRQAPAE